MNDFDRGDFWDKIAMELATLKLMYCDGLVPLPDDMYSEESYANGEMVSVLIKKGYLKYVYDEVTDDEGIVHVFKRGYVLTHKAKDLLEEKAK